MDQQEVLLQQEDQMDSQNMAELIDLVEFEPIPILDIRQKLCWDKYIDPRSPTFGDAKHSAMAAGYSDSTSRVITTLPWFKNKMRRLNMLPRAEKVLKKALTMITADPETGLEKADLMRIQLDAAKHITKTLGKDEGYSERSEITGKDGAPVVFIPSELMDKYSLQEPKQVESYVSTDNRKEQEEDKGSTD